MANDDGESVLGLRHIRDARAREVGPGHQRHDGDEHERREGGQTPEMSPLGRLGSAIRWRYQAFAHDREHRAIVQPMPAHATGSGTISFGLVSIPVKLYTAAASQSVSFNLLHAKCGTRIKLQNFCPVDNEVVDRAALVRGYEFAKDQYVRVSDEELKGLEGEASKVIDIAEFVLQLIDGLSGDAFSPEKYRDEYREHVLELVNQKVEGKEVTAVGPEVKRAQVIDLMEALKQSLAKRVAAQPAAAEARPAPAKKPLAKAKRAEAQPAKKAQAGKK